MYVDDTTLTIIGRMCQVARIAAAATRRLMQAYDGASLRATRTKGQVVVSYMDCARNIAKNLR